MRIRVRLEFAPTLLQRHQEHFRPERILAGAQDCAVKQESQPHVQRGQRVGVQDVERASQRAERDLAIHFLVRYQRHRLRGGARRAFRAGRQARQFQPQRPFDARRSQAHEGVMIVLE